MEVSPGSPSRFSRSGRRSTFYRDISTHTPNSKNMYISNSAQAAAATALRLDGGEQDLPPPPVFTLDEKVDSPIIVPPPQDLSPPRPISNFDNNFTFSLPDANTDKPYSPGNLGKTNIAGFSPVVQRFKLSPGVNVGSSEWWPSANYNDPRVGPEAQGKGPTVQQKEPDQSGTLITVPPLREIVRPDIPDNALNERVHDEEEWVTVFGFQPSETNLVLREFEKCGLVLRHVPGPGDANWMHILYQSHFSAQKALKKNGTQINGIIIVGVKRLDPHHRSLLTEGSNSSLMATLLESPAGNLTVFPNRTMPLNEVKHCPTGAMASPSKSTLSKLVDLLFGM
eukprot:TRINITY_DN19358_c0_g1_i1.p1 TRINITY_DN19358_c0_g1~~TRINITY_DN19358_c0_g1_i1.p1  ORF type:complete len:339 (+),score=53.63 TRINITY_DN19358_c0_g1_i1:100-1116(+)